VRTFEANSNVQFTDLSLSTSPSLTLLSTLSVYIAKELKSRKSYLQVSNSINRRR
jgi:hypothetical protein